MTDHQKQPIRKNTNNVHLKNCSSNSLINIWNKKSVTPTKDEHFSSNTNIVSNGLNKSGQINTKSARQSNPKKTQLIGQSLQSEKVVMSKKQLMQFTKKFAINKIDYEQMIENLKQENQDKTKRIQVLSEQIQQLRLQQDYIMKIMQQLRDRHINQINAINTKSQSMQKMKQGQIDHLGQEITKIREWLEEQKQETKRCMEFLKIKDQIIQNLEWEILKYKNQKSKDITFSKSTNYLQTQNLSCTSSHQYLRSQIKNNALADTTNIKYRELEQKSKEKQQRETQRQTKRQRINSSNSSKKIILRKDKRDQNMTPTKSGSNKNMEIIDKENICTEQRVDINTTLNMFRKALNNKKSTTNLEHDIVNLTNLVNTLKKQKEVLEFEKNQIANKYEQLCDQYENLKRNLMFSQYESRNNHNHHTINYSKYNDNNNISESKKMKSPYKNVEQQNQKDNLLNTKCVFLQKHIKKLTNELNRIQSQGFLEYCEQFSDEEILNEQIPQL